MEKKTTEEILAESFREVSAKKAVNRITVKDIVSNCGMSPTTFYRYYRDKEDLIAQIYERKCREILARYKDSPDWWEEAVREWVDAGVQNRYFLMNLLTNTSGFEALPKQMSEISVRLVEDEILARSGRDSIPEKDHLKFSLHAAGAVRLMCAWALGKISVTQELVTEIIAETGAPLVYALL